MVNAYYFQPEIELLGSLLVPIILGMIQHH